MPIKIHHLYARSDLDVMPVVEKAMPLLKGSSVCLVAPVQHSAKLGEVKAFLEKHGKTVKLHGQILGCSVPKEIPEEDILYVGTGEFHPKGIVITFNRDVVIADPMLNEARVLSKESVADVQKKRKAALVKFLSSGTIGVLISTKSGQKTVQALLGTILKLQEKFPDKQFYFFACATLDFQELENYPFIQAWINTMCPRIGQDDVVRTRKALLNIEDLNSVLSSRV